MFRPSPILLVFALAFPFSSLRADENGRPPQGENDLRYWISNMLAHRFQMGEMQLATKLPLSDLARAIDQVHADEPKATPGSLVVLPYPGGRHPRIGFLDGAIDPQRETKISVFTPWDPGSYVVVDVPEAIWSNLGLTYLAHTHIDTVWTSQNIELAPLEWERRPDGVLKLHRRLPNGIQFGTLVFPARDHVAMAMWLHNGTTEPLSDLRVQNCVMLKKAEGFNALNNDHKVFQAPFVACQSDAIKNRWIITAWEPCHRPWANPPVPCLHSDPKFPDLAPGESAILNGWLSFHEATPLADALAGIGAQWKPLKLEDIAREFVPDRKDP